MTYTAKTVKQLRQMAGTLLKKIQGEFALIETRINLSGDVTLSDAGVATIGTDKVLPSMRNIGDYVEFVDEFAGAAPDAVQWSLNDTSSAGTPTQVYEADETAITLAMDSQSEAQVCSYDFGDKLQFDIDDNPIFIARFKVPTIAANEEAVIGMGAAWNDTLNSSAAHAWFKLDATMDLLVESDDGTNDNDDEDTTINLTADTYIWIKIDFADTADVKFYTGTDGKTWTQRVSGTTFDMSNYTAGLQPMFGVLKASGASTPSISVDIIKVMADRP